MSWFPLGHLQLRESKKIMSIVVRSTLVWIAAFVAVYILVVIANSIGASLFGNDANYGSSRVQQELSGFFRLAIHVAPAIVVAFYRPHYAWQVAGVMSSVFELLDALNKFGRDGFEYIGEPISILLTYVLVAMLSASWMASKRCNKREQQREQARRLG